MNEKDMARFWAKVDVRGPEECWEWMACVDGRGYGQLNIGGKMARAHRVSAWLNGLVDSVAAPNDQSGGGFVLHRCDNKKCCNPWHLESGTHSKNTIDAYLRGIHGRSKLTVNEVKAIRALYAAGGVSQRTIAAQYGVTQSNISMIVNKTNWHHI